MRNSESGYPSHKYDLIICLTRRGYLSQRFLGNFDQLLGYIVSNQFREKSFFRSDMVYAGKDHTKNNKTFIALSSTGFNELKNFRTIQAAMNAADKKWPNLKRN